MTCWASLESKPQPQSFKSRSTPANDSSMHFFELSFGFNASFFGSQCCQACVVYAHPGSEADAPPTHGCTRTEMPFELKILDFTKVLLDTDQDLMESEASERVLQPLPGSVVVVTQHESWERGSSFFLDRTPGFLGYTWK